MKIFVVHSWKVLTDHVANGDGLAAWGLLDGLAKRGHELHVACRTVALASEPPANLRLYSLSSDSDHLRVRERLRYMRRLRALYGSLAGRERFDLIHQTNPVDVGVTLALPRDIPPLVLGPYAADWPREADGPVSIGRRSQGAVSDHLRAALRGAEQRRAAAILLTTPAAREKVSVDGHRASLIEFVAPGVELDALDAAWASGHGEPEPGTILFLANLRFHKGIHTLLDAFETVVAQVPDARLIVGGGGPEEAAVRQRAASAPMRGRVEVLGAVPRGEIAQLMRRTAVFCQPAYDEPVGTSAVEAMACGVPVVATNTGGLQFVVPAEAGIKVPPRDAAVLAAALVSLLGDAGARARLGQAGRRVVQERYNWPRVIDRLEALYNAVVTRRAHADVRIESDSGAERVG